MLTQEKKLTAPRKMSNKFGTEIIFISDRGFENLKATVDAIAQNLGRQYNVIIVDENEDSPEISGFLKAISSHKKSIFRVIRNKPKLGIMKSINRALHYKSIKDLIVINGPEFVKSVSLENMVDLAYTSGKSVMTVMKLALPETQDTLIADSYKAIKKNKSLIYYPHMDDGTGFCLFIKRRALDLCPGFTIATYEPTGKEDLRAVVSKVFYSVVSQPLPIVIISLIGYIILLAYGPILSIYSVIIALWVVYKWDSRILAFFALLLLITIPFLLMSKMDATAEIIAQQVYFLLVLTVGFQIFEYRSSPKTENEEDLEEMDEDRSEKEDRPEKLEKSENIEKASPQLAS